MIDSAKRGKATGIDNIPTEVLKNDTAVSFLHFYFISVLIMALFLLTGVNV